MDYRKIKNKVGSNGGQLPVTCAQLSCEDPQVHKDKDNMASCRSRALSSATRIPRYTRTGQYGQLPVTCA